MDEITRTLMGGGDIELGAKRTILQGAVARQIMCPYSGEILDMRKAVLLDGTDYGKHMHVMTAEVYDAAVEGGIWNHWNVDDYDILDGRELFKK